MSKIFAVLLLVSMQTTAQKRDLFVGTYTRGESKGIYVYSFRPVHFHHSHSMHRGTACLETGKEMKD